MRLLSTAVTMILGAALCLTGCGDDGSGGGGSAAGGGAGGSGGMAGSGGVGGSGGTGGSADTACPTMFEIQGFGWGSPDGTDIGQFSSVALELTFTNDVDGDLNVAEFNVMTTPGGETPAITSSNLPIPVVGMGTQFTVMVTLDLSAISNTETGLRFELTDDTRWGNLRNDRLTLDRTDMVTCTP